MYNNYCSNNVSNKKEVNNNNAKNYNYIKKKIPNKSLDKKDKQNKNMQNKIKKISKDKISFNIQYLEELLILDDKFNLIITKIDSAESKSISNECFDFLNYFYNSIIYINFEQIMNDSENYEVINQFIKYVLLSIILCYDLSLDSDTINMHLKLSEILEINYKSFIIILEMVYDKIDIENKDNNDNFWINNLSILINNWKYLNETEINILNKKNISKIESININIKLVNSKIEYIIVNYSKSLNKCLYSLFKKINDKSIEDINYFYREYILREDNLGCSILASSYLKVFQNFTPEKVPYIRDMNKKKFTLVLDLEETLVHFNIEENYEEGILKLRPGVLQFLAQVSQYYELVLFSEASQEYSDLILEAFEENKKYFDYKLYRQHTVIKNQDFIKDLTRLGRPLNTIIIVDNMPQNFRLQNINGISIKPFRGEDINDRALFDLSTILINIAKEYSDVRNGLSHYHQEIVTKIVSNIYKHYK
jgi:Dullard-like phosphatase family protein